MAVPKRRTSRSNTRSRRANWKATAPDLVPVTIGGVVYRVPRRLVARCGGEGSIRPGCESCDASNSVGDLVIRSRGVCPDSATSWQMSLGVRAGGLWPDRIARR
jgi:large subunit ribosomal protein L32